MTDIDNASVPVTLPTGEVRCTLCPWSATGGREIAARFLEHFQAAHVKSRQEKGPRWNRWGEYEERECSASQQGPRTPPTRLARLLSWLRRH